MKLKALITDEGVLKPNEGIAIEGIGITDLFGNDYPAGLDEEGNLIVNSCDDSNRVLTLDGQNYIPNFMFPGNYKHLIGVDG